MRKSRGFSIIELLVVISVVSILIGVVLPRFKGMQDEANIPKAKAELKTIQTALESWYINIIPHIYPSENSTTPCNDFLIYASPKIISEPFYDPFGAPSQEYTYYVDETNYAFYAVVSAGPDGELSIEGIDEGGVLLGDAGDDIYVTNGTGF